MNALQATGLVLFSYTAYIEYKRQVKKSLIRQHIRNPKEQGSVILDETTMDSIKTGDVLLFARKWYRYHLPMAAMIKAYQSFHDTEFDHCAVVLLDPLTAIPYIVETNPFQGPTIRRLDHRLKFSSADAILLIRVNSEINNQSNFQNFPKLLHSSVPSEVIGIFKSIILSILSSYIYNESNNNDNSDEVIQCPSTKLLNYTYKKFGLEFKSYGLKTISCKNIYQREVDFTRITIPRRTLKLSNEDVYLKSI